MVDLRELLIAHFRFAGSKVMPLLSLLVNMSVLGTQLYCNWGQASVQVNFSCYFLKFWLNFILSCTGLSVPYLNPLYLSLLLRRLLILVFLGISKKRPSTYHTEAKSRSSGQPLRHSTIGNILPPVTSGAMGVSYTRYGPWERNRSKN